VKQTDAVLARDCDSDRFAQHGMHEAAAAVDKSLPSHVTRLKDCFGFTDILQVIKRDMDKGQKPKQGSEGRRMRQREDGGWGGGGEGGGVGGGANSKAGAAGSDDIVFDSAHEAQGQAAALITARFLCANATFAHAHHSN
jgi:hypothetical protein